MYKYIRLLQFARGREVKKVRFVYYCLAVQSFQVFCTTKNIWRFVLDVHVQATDYLEPIIFRSIYEHPRSLFIGMNVCAPISTYTWFRQKQP